VRFVALDLTNADFTNADLSHADLTGCILAGAQFAGAKGLDSVKGLEIGAHAGQANR
jgi:uncharacterized protein YjbI with pentapeptide repeats